MKIEINAFGIARDIIGERKVHLEIDLPTTAEKLKEYLVVRFPAFQQVSAFNIAIGDNYAQENDMIHENDVITIIPPVSGG